MEDKTEKKIKESNMSEHDKAVFMAGYALGKGFGRMDMLFKKMRDNIMSVGDNLDKYD